MKRKLQKFHKPNNAFLKKKRQSKGVKDCRFPEVIIFIFNSLFSLIEQSVT